MPRSASGCVDFVLSPEPSEPEPVAIPKVRPIGTH
jgi:hypothetical protein